MERGDAPIGQRPVAEHEVGRIGDGRLEVVAYSEGDSEVPFPEWPGGNTQQNLISSFPWITPNNLQPGAIQGKEGIRFCSVA